MTRDLTSGDPHRASPPGQQSPRWISKEASVRPEGATERSKKPRRPGVATGASMTLRGFEPLFHP